MSRPSLTEPLVPARVVSARWRSANLREVVLAYRPGAFRPVGADQFVYVVVPSGRELAPTVDRSPRFTMEALLALDEAQRPPAAYYTIRRWDRRRHQIVLWVVAHDHAGSAGAWFSSCRPGVSVALWGPRRGASPPPQSAEWWMFSDETGFAAVAALLDHKPAGVRAHVVAESEGVAETVCELGWRAGTRVVWHRRHGRAPGAALVDALSATLVATPTSTPTAPSGSERRSLDGAFVFVATEAAAAADMRRLLRAHGVPTAQQSVTGYWRRSA